MSKLFFSSVAAAALVAALPTVHAESTPTSPATSAQTATQQPAQATMVHFEGCLFTEPALTATVPIVVPAGVPQKWVLTNVKVVAGDVKDEEAGRTTYGLATVKDDQARSFYSKRVGVTGRVAAGTPRPTLSVVDLREISGGCPTLPSLS